MYRIAIAIIMILTLLFASFAFADEHPTYKVGIKEAKPFSYQEDGEWKGLSVDLIKELSKQLGFQYEFYSFSDIETLLQETHLNAPDFSVAAISMTDEREKTIDFSHPYFMTTQGILVEQNGNVVWWVAKRVLIAIATLVGLMYFVGMIISWLDPNDAIDNPHKGAWFALVTFTTTGYGDFVPDNAKAKTVTALWMIASLFLLSIFTGYIASSWTVKKLTDEPTTISSLYNSKVVTIQGSTSQTTLSTLGIPYKTSDSLGDALFMMEHNKANAIVYDKAMLDFIAVNGDNDFRVWPINQGQERYAIAFPPNSGLREDFNVALLSILDSPTWKNVKAKYFGNE